ncbi:MAG TPA: ABC transporter permease [Streptosporangiaceae bacterium]|nr:ABC transporter permease [Streptosporangiaceae bacterium]
MSGARQPSRTGSPGTRAQSFRSLSRAMFLGYVRDRAALVFSILIPVLFLVLLGSIYKSTTTPRITVLEVGRVSLLDQARPASPRQLAAVMTVRRAASLAAALREVRVGTDDAAVQKHGARLTVHYSVADATRSAEVAAVFTSIVQLFVFLAIATLPYFGLKLTASWWMSIPVVICGTLAFMSIGLLVGALAKTQQAATSIANLIILPMAFLGGAFVPLDFAPNWMRDVSYVMPLRYLVTGTQNVMARGLGAASALPAIVVLLGFTAVLTVIAARAFRWDEI